MVEVGERLEFGSEMGQAAPLSRRPATVLLKPAGGPSSGGWCGAHIGSVGHGARALGRPLSRRAGRVGVIGRGLVGLSEIRALGALFPTSADVARSRSPVVRPVLPSCSSLT